VWHLPSQSHSTLAIIRTVPIHLPHTTLFSSPSSIFPMTSVLAFVSADRCGGCTLRFRNNKEGRKYNLSALFPNPRPGPSRYPSESSLSLLSLFPPPLPLLLSLHPCPLLPLSLFASSSPSSFQHPSRPSFPSSFIASSHGCDGYAIHGSQCNNQTLCQRKAKRNCILLCGTTSTNYLIALHCAPLWSCEFLTRLRNLIRRAARNCYNPTQKGDTRGHHHRAERHCRD